MSRNRLVYLLVTMNIALIAVLVKREMHEPRAVAITNAYAAPMSSPSPPAARRNEIVAAAERVSPAIVSVGASRTGYLVSPFANFFSEFTVYPYQQRIPYLGSGVVIDTEGHIVTNHHVIQGAEEIFVTLMDGRELPAKLLDADPFLDIGLLKVEAKDLKPAPLGDSANLLVGEWVLAMGNPFGNLMGDRNPTVTAGVVSALKRSFRPNQELQRIYQDMIQTDAAINPGNSGGALINTAGELIGINTFIMSRSGGSEGIGFAIPVNRVKSVVNEIRQFGKVRPRWVDFDVQNMNQRIQKLLKANTDSGAVISEMQTKGPAERAGLQVGDVIVAVDGKPVKDADDFLINVYGRQVGSMLKCEVDRGGERVTVNYEVQERQGK